MNCNWFQVDKIEANAGGAGASADVLKKLKDLELENKDLKKGESDLPKIINLLLLIFYFESVKSQFDWVRTEQSHGLVYMALVLCTSNFFGALDLMETNMCAFIAVDLSKTVC